MKKLACIVVAVFVVAFAGAKLATQEQALVMDAISRLGLEMVPSDLAGAPQTFKVTKKTLRKLREGSTVVVKLDGSVELSQQ